MVVCNSSMNAQTTIYLAPYHSQPGACLEGSSGRFRLVEQAIADGEWPYDNGDDPSFYAARHGGRLTWGVCRQQVRNAIGPASVVVFFSYTKDGPAVLYCLSAIATVSQKLDRRKVFSDPQLRASDYLNIMLSRHGLKWKYDEEDHPPRQDARHGDWLWRMAEHGREKNAFSAQYAPIYANREFGDGEVPMACNYVVFSDRPDETYVSPNPPVVATGRIGEHEAWTNSTLKDLTVGTAAQMSRTGRDFLRTENRSGRNVHPAIRFEMPTHEAARWRGTLIAALRQATEPTKKRLAVRVQTAGVARC